MTSRTLIRGGGQLTGACVQLRFKRHGQSLGTLGVGLSRHGLVEVLDDVRYLRVEVGVRYVRGGGAVTAVRRGAEVLRHKT